MNSYSKTILNRALAGVIVLVMLCSLIPFGAVSAFAKAKSGVEELMAQSIDSDAFAPEEGYKIKTRSTKPECFDLRHVDENGVEKSYITPVKVQNPFGACWGFGAISAAESSIISAGLKDKNGNPASVDTMDLSEKQLVWFEACAIADTENSQYGEGAVFREDSTVTDRYDIGGGTGFATNLFACGVGPVSEDTDTDDGKIFAYHGKNSEVNSEMVTWVDDNNQEQSGIRKTYYSDEDDWSMPEKYRFASDYQLRESYLLPNPINSEHQYQPQATEAIKEQLLSKHAVSISFQATHSVAGEDESAKEDYVMSANWAQYSTIPSQNHVVTIVGYDDNYPRENFVKGNEPPADGAWLVKNSWGSDLNDFPNNGYAHWGLYEGQDVVGSNYQKTSEKHTGYFWLSYYDASINGPEAYLFEDKNEDLIYNQYDYMPVEEYARYDTEAENKMSNIFTAKGNELLKDISIFTATPGTKVSYEIYLLADEAKNPEDGVLVYSSAEKEYPFGGFHRQALPEDSNIYLCKGQKYAVIISEKTPSDKYSISFGTIEKEPRHASNPRSFNSVINKGESFLYIDGKWMDMSDEEVQTMLLADESGVIWNTIADNFPIKAFTVPSESKGAYLVVANRNKYTVNSIGLKLNETIPLQAMFKGASDDLEELNPNLEWKSADSEIFTVETNNSNAYKATITPKNTGTSYLIADAGKYGKRIIPVTVNKYELVSASIGDDQKEQVYSGQEIKPSIEKICAEPETDYQYVTDLTEGKDYTLEYKNNVLCGKAEISVIGTGEYGGRIDNNEFFDELAFIILPAKAKITKAVGGNEKITIGFDSQKASGISGYVLSWNEKGSTQVQTKFVAPSSVSTVITGLQSGKEYDISLKAYVEIYDKKEEYDEKKEEYVPIGNVKYFGKESDTVSCKVNAPVPKTGELKSASINSKLSATPTITVNSAKKQMNLKFKANGADNYLVRWRLAGGKWNYAYTNGNTDFTINNLGADKLYDVQLTALKKLSNGWQRSPYSKVQNRLICKAKINKVTASKKQIQVQFSKLKPASKYQLLIAESKDLSKGRKVLTISKNQLAATVKNLKSKQNYYICLRAVRVQNKTNYYGEWSQIKTVKTK